MTTTVRRPRMTTPVEDRLSNLGKSWPLGATCVDRGVNFSVFSRTAAQAEILLFDHVDDPKPARVVSLHPADNRTYHYWHTFIRDLTPGQL